MHTALPDFPPAPQPADRKARLAAAILTALLYAGLLLLWQQRDFWSIPDTIILPVTVMRLSPDTPRMVRAAPPQPVIAHLIRPQSESIAPPSFTIAPDAPAQLPVTAVKASPLDAGAATGTGTGAQTASASSASTGPSACLDPQWMRAITNRVRRFFYYPETARARGARGLVMVHFIVRRDGLLDTLEIGRSSGDRALDDAAYEMVQKAIPLPAIPDHMHTDKVDGLLPISFGSANVIFNPSAGNCGG